jgi:hypothetical protein
MRRELELGWRCLAKCDVAENSGAGSTRVPRTTAQFTKPPNQKPSQFLNIYSSIIILPIKTILGLFDSA